MREYKFRGKSKDIGWVYGQLAYDINGNVYIIQEVELDSSYGLEETILFATMWYRVDKETVGQYTGLHDKNGKEIYEGDIVRTQPYYDRPFSKKAKSKPHIGVVKYEVKCGKGFVGNENEVKYWGAEWRVEIKDYGKYVNCAWGDFFECEVIGNIYENKELLNETDR